MRLTVTTIGGLSCTIVVDASLPLTVCDVKRQAAAELFTRGPAAAGTLPYRRLALQGVALADDVPLAATSVREGDVLLLVVVAATRLAAGSPDGSVRILDVAAGQEDKFERLCFRFGDAVSGLAWSPDGGRVAVASNFRDDRGRAHGRFALFEASTGDLKSAVADLRSHAVDVDWARFAAKDHEGLVVADSHGVVMPRALLDKAQGDFGSRQIQLQSLKIASAALGTAWVTDVAWSPDGTRVCVAAAGHNACGGVAAFSADHSARLLWSLDCWCGVHAVEWSPDGSRVAAGSGDGRGNGGTVHLISAGRVERFWRVEYPVRSVSWSPDGAQLGAGTGDGLRGRGSLHVFAVEKQEKEKTWELGAVCTAVSWSPDGDRLAVATEDSLLRLYPMTEAKAQDDVARWTLRGPARRLAWSPVPDPPAASAATNPSGESVANGAEH
eukprot:TRINITY_DN73249_c0_g1_i1.p1 TRINITY_DN73249_c0_g1~~TRINITY_DN73249_c0_g1_i1.p1  ORF type:complete len:465 (-),score=80.05 TRINITY_DN73249_c0_g1_i1:74-1396(-)